MATSQRGTVSGAKFIVSPHSIDPEVVLAVSVIRYVPSCKKGLQTFNAYCAFCSIRAAGEQTEANKRLLLRCLLRSRL